MAKPKTAAYAYPKGVGKHGARYPIFTKAKARAARSYGARKDTAGSLRTIDAAIKKRYGSVPAIYKRRGHRLS